ncbi:MAG TPA: hypothetical protein VF885_00675 [Arthrobacter sp.]
MIRDRAALLATAGLLGAGGVLAAAHIVALEAGAGPDRTAQIIQLSQAEFDAMTDTQLSDMRHNLRSNNDAGTVDAKTAATIVRINNALTANP